MPFNEPSILDIGDLVRHPLSGHIGFITGQDAIGMWRVDWFASKQGHLLAKSVHTIEYDPVLHLMLKAARA